MEPQSELSERLVDWLREVGLAVPASVVLDAVGPFSALAENALYLFQPFMGSRAGDELVRLLKDSVQRQKLLDDLGDERMSS